MPDSSDKRYPLTLVALDAFLRIASEIIGTTRSSPLNIYRYETTAQNGVMRCVSYKCTRRRLRNTSNASTLHDKKTSDSLRIMRALIFFPISKARDILLRSASHLPDTKYERVKPYAYGNAIFGPDAYILAHRELHTLMGHVSADGSAAK